MSYLSLKIKCSEAQADTLSAIALDRESVGTAFENGELQVYFQDPVSLEDFGSCLPQLGLGPGAVEEIADRNWNSLWEENFHDQTIDDIHVRAPFHPSKGLPFEIVIHPKMAFGTGHHGTTQLMLKALRKLNVRGKKLLDMGCGSGILAILASMQGADEVTAIDYDIHSVENSRENVQLNSITNVEILQADNLDNVTTTFDIILSNIVKNINMTLVPQFVERLRPGGQLALCGLLIKDQDEVAKQASALNLTLIGQATQDEWLQLTFQKQ